MPRKPRKPRPQVEPIVSEEVARYGTSERVFGSVPYVEMRRIRRMPTRNQGNPEKAIVQGKGRQRYIDDAACDRAFAKRAAEAAARTAERSARIAELLALAN